MMDLYRMIPVKARDVVSAGYDKERSILYIEFRTGLSYQYFDVPRHVYTGLLNAEAPDRFFGDHIRNRYSFKRLPFYL